MSNAAKRQPLTAAALMTPALLMVLVFLLMPLALLLRYSFNAFEPGKFMVEALTLANYGAALTDPYYRGVLGTTVSVAAGVTALCLVAGFPIALCLARTTSRFKSLMILAVIMPLFVGNAVRAAGWMVAFGQQGLFNKVMISLGLLSTPLEIMYSVPAVIIGITAVNLPYVVLTLQSVLEGINRSTDDAALSLGATPFEAWRLVTLPQAMPGVMAAAVLSLILAMNAYATPVLLGGPGFQMMAPVLADEILSKNNWPMGASLAFVLITITVLLTVAMHGWLARRARYLRDA